MPEFPLAYFITFSTYGTWLHGDSTGSVDRAHNQPGAPLLPPDAQRQRESRERMVQDPYFLDELRRVIVRDAIVEECKFRGWRLLALHVRSNHVHVVVTADREPEYVMRCCKSQASKRLNQAGLDCSERKRWTTHGRTKYLWNESAVAEKVDYSLYRQGAPMAIYQGV